MATPTRPRRLQKVPTVLKQARSQGPSDHVYIAKPEAGSQGRGIFLFKKSDNFHSDEPLVVQEYINRPFTMEGLKFDFRIYVLLKSISPLKIFMYRQGLSRFATHPYEQAEDNNLQNLTMHLTNYAINKRNPSFIFNKAEDEDNIGHKRSYTAIIQALKQLGKDTHALQKQIEEIIVKTILSAEEKLVSYYQQCRPLDENVCFQILGFDVMLDERLKPYLIEVNHSPSFSTDAPIDMNVKKHLILDTLNLLQLSYQDKKNYLTHKDASSSKPSRLSVTQSHASGVMASQYQNTHIGGYKRIYPSQNVHQNKYYEEVRHEISPSRVKKRLRVSLPQYSNPYPTRLVKRKSQQKHVDVICTTQQTSEDSPLKMYGLSESAVIRDNRTENRPRHPSNLMGDRDQSSADSKLSGRSGVRLTNIKFETTPLRDNSRTFSQIRLFRQFQIQNNMTKASSKANLQLQPPSPQTINTDDEEEQFYRKRYKKISLFNFEQSVLIQRRLEIQSKRAMQSFTAELNFSSQHGKFNPVRNWRDAPKLRFHRVRNMQQQHHLHPTAGGFHGRPVSEDDKNDKKYLSRNG